MCSGWGIPCGLYLNNGGTFHRVYDFRARKEVQHGLGVFGKRDGLDNLDDLIAWVVIRPSHTPNTGKGEQAARARARARARAKTGEVCKVWRIVLRW